MRAALVILRVNPGKKTIQIFFMLFLSFSVLAQNVSECPQEIRNLLAFARMYGQVRYFYPSDENVVLNWDKFAVFGVKKVVKAENDFQLKRILNSMFYPVATQHVLLLSDEETQSPVYSKPEGDKLIPVWWYHSGLMLDPTYPVFVSYRKNCNDTLPAFSAGYGLLTQALNVSEFRGMEFRIRVYMRAEVKGSANRGQLWAQVESKDNQQKQFVSFYENSELQSATSPSWKAYEIKGRFDSSACRLLLGAILNGSGRLWLDEFQFAIKDKEGNWRNKTLFNGGFEQGKFKKEPKGWLCESNGYSYIVTGFGAYKGDYCLLIQNDLLKLRLPYEPNPFGNQAMVIEENLTDKIKLWLPTVLYRNEQGIVFNNDKDAFAKLTAEVNKINSSDTFDVFGNLAGIVIVWNVLKHFYPYQDEVVINWDSVFIRTCAKTFTDETISEFYNTLQLMLSTLRDGQAGVYHPLINRQKEFSLNAEFLWINDTLVVKESRNENLMKGDIVISIDGESTSIWLEKRIRNLSGSYHRKQYTVLEYIEKGEENQIVLFKINRTGCDTFVSCKYAAPVSTLTNDSFFKILKDNTLYFDLTRLSYIDIQPYLKLISRANAVIFDLRGDLKPITPLLSHLLSFNDTSTSWMQIPQITWSEPMGKVFQPFSWRLTSRIPHFYNDIIFLADNRTVGYGEVVLSYIKTYKLGKIVGQTSAGIAGNINSVFLPGFYKIDWTGMKVTQLDGSSIFLKGIEPDYIIPYKVNSILEGKDDFIEKSLEVISFKHQ